MINLFKPYIPKFKILKELYSTLTSGWIGQGPKVDQFEKEFNKKFGYKYSVMVNSGTSALELVYHLLGLKEGDKVVVPVLDAVCGQMGLLRRKCKILFCDIERGTLCIDPGYLEKLLKKHKVKAVIGVHLSGIHFSEGIYSLCKKYKVPLIVDAAQYVAPTKGDYICYSFQAIKQFTTGDGGMLVLNNKKEYDRAKKLRWFGIDRTKKSNSWRGRDITSDIEEAGYKFQPTDIDASFGLVGLADLDKITEYRRKLVIEYCKFFTPGKSIRKNTTHLSFWIQLDKYRDQLADYLTANGVEVNLVHTRQDLYKIFGGKRLELPKMNYVEKRYLYLPLHTGMSISDVRYICKLIEQFYATNRIY